MLRTGAPPEKQRIHYRSVVNSWLWILVGIGVVIAAVALYDVTQKRHTILRNFPVIGHLRYALESIGPELRQYIVTDNDEERPFSRPAPLDLRVGKRRKQLFQLRNR